MLLFASLPCGSPWRGHLGHCGLNSEPWGMLDSTPRRSTLIPSFLLLDPGGSPRTNKASLASCPQGCPPSPSLQMGLLVDLSPEGTAGDDTGDDAAELEAELLALVGGQAAPGEKSKGKSECCRCRGLICHQLLG